ncbi:lysine-2,3-aminomutase-like protein [Gemmobacter serpentinus]|uniref:lysine-2,3-aminomutase-like protein n=1 Tax=Gemmobacter serpentinus TaxID=2652247 RepID=UPI00124E4024|nr:lysine-2,3-aminomutase-like protein [Gemmobacter serpentinus]
MTSLTTVPALIAGGHAPAEDGLALEQVVDRFRLRISPAMTAALGSDGVARQFVPQPQELQIRPEERADPIGDQTFSPAPGLTHRYPDRVILAVTQICEVYCRFCFRRETVGATGILPDADLEAALAYIAATPAISEVILTGGDPLSLSPRRLGMVLDRLQAIPSVETARIHSRVPVVAPERMDAAMIAVLDRDLPVHLVIHTNHPDELTEAARAAIRRLNRAGIAMFSQSVLLRGVNDDADVLEALFRALLRNRVKPYYLHHCDLAEGTSHFRTTIEEGRALMALLKQRLSGIALPHYVLDIPGGAGKVMLTPAHAECTAPGQWQITDRLGGTHRYDDPERG